MALISINRNPSKVELTWFGLMTCAFLWFLGPLIWWWTGATWPIYWLGGIGVVFGVVFYALRPLRRPLYLGWMVLVYPIGWTVSHLMLGIVYFLVLTPIGWCMRLFGRDAMRRKFDREASSYWTPRKPAANERYFRQF